MQVTPVLADGFHFHGGLCGKPVGLFRVSKGERRKIDFGAQGFQTNILQAVGDTSFDLRDGARAAGDFIPVMC